MSSSKLCYVVIISVFILLIAILLLIITYILQNKKIIKLLEHLLILICSLILKSKIVILTFEFKDLNLDLDNSIKKQEIIMDIIKIIFIEYNDEYTIFI